MFGTTSLIVKNVSAASGQWTRRNGSRRGTMYSVTAQGLTQTRRAYVVFDEVDIEAPCMPIAGLRYSNLSNQACVDNNLVSTA